MQITRGMKRFDSFQLDFTYLHWLFDIFHIEVKRVSSKSSLQRETKKTRDQLDRQIPKTLFTCLCAALNADNAEGRRETYFAAVIVQMAISENF